MKGAGSCRKTIPFYQAVGCHIPEDHNHVTNSCVHLRSHERTWSNATGFRCWSSVKHILNKDAISHIATDVEPQTSEVMTPEGHYIYSGLLTA
jgi:hypothetical protein